jgi:acetyl esterase
MTRATRDDEAGSARVHPYYRRILDLYAQSGRPYFHQLTASEAREMLRAGAAAAPPPRDLPELAEVADLAVPGAAGAIPIRRYRPLGEAWGLCIYLHAGGWIMGDLDFSDATCRRLAAGPGARW